MRGESRRQQIKKADKLLQAAIAKTREARELLQDAEVTRHPAHIDMALKEMQIALLQLDNFNKKYRHLMSNSQIEDFNLVRESLINHGEKVRLMQR